ncbi:MAG: DNA topoisomerase I [Candidatus Bilamarchaeaceae archaeon]
MELIVAEKPKVAEKIAFSLGKSVKKAKGGVSYYEVDGGEKVVASAVGHVFTLTEKKKTNNYPVFDIEWVPAYKVSKGADFTKKYVDLLESLSKKADSFVSACDYDIEGSLIAYNVYKYVYGKKEAKRMKFSTVTIPELKKSYDSLEDMDYNNAYAGEARHMLDWFYGINLSRALMAAIKRADSFKVMSIGRVQGPALHMLTDLERDIAKFVPTPYWELKIKSQDFEFTHEKARFLVEEEAKRSLENTGKTAVAESVKKEEEFVGTLPNFDLTSLQMEAYRLFKIKPAHTLELAQKLYENSYISYPRTSSQKLPPQINVRGILEKFADANSANQAYAQIAKKLLDEDKTRPMQGKKEDKAHPAIHPTGVVPQSLDKYEAKLYDLIVRRFLASFEIPAKRMRTSVALNSNGEKYKASGAMMVDKGWTAIYGDYYKGEDKELPPFTQGNAYNVDSKKKDAKKTQPPRRYTDASIISELEKRELGTKATRATIVETLHKRNYITGTNITVTEFGIHVVEVLEKYAPEILDEELTRKIETDMEKIQDGQKDKEEVIREGKEMLVKILDGFKKNELKIGQGILGAIKEARETASTLGVCGKCGNNLRIIRMGGGKQFVGCSGYPNCRNAFPLPGGALITSTGKVCEHCKTPIVNVIRKGKRPFEMCLETTCVTKKDWAKKSYTKKEDAKKEDTTGDKKE